MLKISIQYFGGRGGKGSGGSRGGGRAGGGASGGAPEQTWDSSHTARQDFYSAGNYKALQGNDFSKDLAAAENAPVGSTARIRYADKTEQYARKTAENTWTSDTGSRLTNNDLASAASPATGAKVRLNTIVQKAKPNPSSAAVGTKLSMGGYTYTKNRYGKWTTYKNGKRQPDRTNADIKRVFT